MIWISVKYYLPLAKYQGQKVTCDFLVTVYPKDLDPNEGPHVIMLWFNAENGWFSMSPGGGKYEDEHDHFVTHWTEKPKPGILAA